MLHTHECTHTTRSQVLRTDLNTSDNRWFEHMRDELQKVTQSHLDAIDEYEARLQQVKDVSLLSPTP